MKHFITNKNNIKWVVVFFTVFASYSSYAQTVFFQGAASSGSEGLTLKTIILSITSVSPTAQVDYTVTGTATEGTDFTLADGTITFNFVVPQIQLINIPITDDMDIETDETIIITLSNPVNCVLGDGTPLQPIVYTYTIEDNEPGPTVQFNTVASTDYESVSPVDFRVDLSEVSPLDVEVNYSVTGGSATSGTDYLVLGSGTLTIPAGDLFANIAANIINDVLIEVDETIQITLTSPVNGTLGANTVHVFTIIDDDNPIKVFFQGSASAASEAITSKTIVLSITTPSPTSQVDYTVTGGTATGGGTDYTLLSGTLTFDFFVPTIQLLTFSINDDGDPEANETIIITLSNPINCNLGNGTGAQPVVYTYTIEDDDTVLPVELISFDATKENNTVSLDWKTASEIDNDFFSVERSSNGVDFFEIGQVVGNGTTNELQQYDFVDKSPLNGVSYYRLRQVDYDGAFEYSNVADVSIALANFAFNVYPNPIEDNRAIVEMRNVGEGDASIRVYNSVGKVVLNKTVALNPNQALKYDLAFERNTPTGIYIVEVRSGQNRYIRKVVIQ